MNPFATHGIVAIVPDAEQHGNIGSNPRVAPISPDPPTTEAHKPHQQQKAMPAITTVHAPATMPSDEGMAGALNVRGNDCSQ